MERNISERSPEVVQVKEEKPVAVVSYRGYDVPVYIDDPGQQYWCLIDSEEIGLGAYDPFYEENIRFLVDEKLDVVKRFAPPYYGAELRWFDNGGWRDLRLAYRSRVLKVWPMDQDSPDAEGVLEEAEEVLRKAVGEGADGRLCAIGRKLN